MLRYALLGVVQGLTEWFPVSSSGHLVFLQHFINIQSPVFFDALVHFASLLVILAVFWKDILSILKAPFRYEFKAYRKYWWLIPIATFPAVVFGVAYQEGIESMFTGFGFLAYTFLFTTVILLLSRFRAFKRMELNPSTAFAIGFAQAIALLPGVSRSGMTLAIALIIGIKKKEAGRFAFLLALPAIAGAFVLQASKVSIASVDLTGVVVGFVAAFIVGVISLRFLLKILEWGKLHYFAIWTLIMAILSFVLR